MRDPYDDKLILDGVAKKMVTALGWDKWEESVDAMAKSMGPHQTRIWGMFVPVIQDLGTLPIEEVLGLGSVNENA